MSEPVKSQLESSTSPPCENCDPKRLTPRQQLAYIARKVSQGIDPSSLGSDLIQGLAASSPARTLGRRQQLLESFRSPLALSTEQEALEDCEQSTTVSSCLVEGIADQQILHDLTIIANTQSAPALSQPEGPLNDSQLIEMADRPESESASVYEPYGFLTSEIADFIRSTDDVGRLRTEILAQERESRRTSNCKG